MKRILVLLSLVLSVSIGYSGQPTPITVSPRTDMNETLGAAGLRWLGVYTKTISDGEGKTLYVDDIDHAIKVTTEKDHSDLTIQSRSKKDAHPIAAITGLADILQPATVNSDGLMSALDKGKLDTYVNNDFVDTDTLTAALSAKADTALVNDCLAVKADLVGGVIPTSQLPPGIIKNLWTVTTTANLVTLKSAVVNDDAYISDGTDAGHIYKLVALPSTNLANWVDSTGSGNVVSVNGKDGAVTIGLDSLPDVVAALSAKADATAITAKANIASPTFTGIPKAPTPTATANSAQIANTTWVNTKLKDYLLSAGGTMTGAINAINHGIIFPASHGKKIELYKGYYTFETSAGSVNLRSLRNSGNTYFMMYHDSDNGETTTRPFYIANNKLGLSNIYLGNGDAEAPSGNPTYFNVRNEINARAPLASPAFTGTPTAPNAASGTSNTQIATTKFVQDKVTSISASIPSMPKQAAGLGQWHNIGANSNSITLPSGGTWAYSIIAHNVGALSYLLTYSGVAAGGSIVAVDSEGIYKHGFAWRIK